MKLNIVLYEPEIPPNTGSIARTCAAIGAELHLIEPLGFSLKDRYLKRAGLDYWSLVKVTVHADWATFFRCTFRTDRWAMLTTKGTRDYTEIEIPPSDDNLWIVFGPETRGLPHELLASNPRRNYRIPMRADARSLNLSNAVAVVAYDIMRRTGFPDLDRIRSER